MIDHLEGGGAERIAVGLARALDGSTFHVAVCATRAPDGPMARELEAAGIRVLLLGRGRGRRRSLTGWAALLRVLRRERVDILNAHKFGSNAWGAVLGRAARVPVVIATEHTWSYEGQPVRRLVDRHVIARLSSAFVAVSHRDAERMRAIEGVPADKIRVIRTAFLPREASGGAMHDLRAELGLAPDAPVVGTLCVMRPQKALEVLLEAFALVVAERPDARLVIAGDGARRADLERRAAELGLGERCLFLGRREDADRVLATLDVFAMSSDFEGTPLALLEAMAAGIPSVATEVGGLPEVADGDAAVLVPPRRPDLLAHEIGRLLDHPAERRELGRRGRARATDAYGISRMVSAWEGLYRELAAARGRPG